MAIVALLCTLLEYHLLIYFLQLNGYYRHLEQLLWRVHPLDEACLHELLISSNRPLATLISSSRCHRQVYIASWAYCVGCQGESSWQWKSPPPLRPTDANTTNPVRYIWVAYTMIMCSMIQICAFLCPVDEGRAFRGPCLHIGSTCTLWRALGGDGSSMGLPYE